MATFRYPGTGSKAPRRALRASVIGPSSGPGEQHTISGAARTLGYTQPAVSQHIRRLERRLGTAVLERHARGVRLTEAGAVLARYGSSVAAGVEAAEREVLALAGLSSGRVRLVSFPSASATVVPAALVALRRQAPGVEVVFRDVEPPDSLAELSEGRCDIVLTFDYPSSPAVTGRDGSTARLQTRHLLTEPCVLALPVGDPLSERRRLHLRELENARWIAGCPRCRRHLEICCGAVGFTPTIDFETDDYVATLAFVSAGLGVALLPGLVGATAARFPGVAVRSVGGTSRRTVLAVTTTDLLRVPAVATLMNALQEAAAVH